MFAQPDVLLIGAEWPTRALLNAQLLEEGLEVVAFDGWPIPARYARGPLMPRGVIVDLLGLPEPERVIAELTHMISPQRVLVVTAQATLAPDDLRNRGFHVVTRPASVGDIVSAAKRLLQEQSDQS
jgi:hypothetical protein